MEVNTVEIMHSGMNWTSTGDLSTMKIKKLLSYYMYMCLKNLRTVLYVYTEKITGTAFFTYIVNIRKTNLSS